MKALATSMVTTRILVAAGLFGLPSASVLAQPADVVLLPAEGAAKIPARYLQRVDKALARDAGNARVVEAAERKKITPAICGGEAACWADVGRQMVAVRVIAPRLTAEGDTFRLSLEMIESATGSVLAKSEDTIARTELTKTPAKTLAQLLRAATADGSSGSTTASAGSSTARPPTSVIPSPGNAATPPRPATASVGPGAASPVSDSAPATSINAPAVSTGAEPPTRAPAEAGTAVARSGSRDRRLAPNFLIGARFGVVVPQGFNKLQSNFLVEVEGAYQLPFFKRRFGIFLGVGYTQPTEHGSRTDPRIMSNGGTVSYDMTVRDLGFALGVQYRHAIGNWVVPYLGVGAKLHLTETIVDQKAGTIDLGENTERNTRIGFIGRLGVGFHLGPGDLVVEGQLEYTPVDHLITGDNNTAHFAFQVGYLFRI